MQLVQACLRAPYGVADEAKLAIVFTYFLFSFFFLLLRLLLFTHFGESPVRENLFPPIFWHNSKIYAKKYFFLGNFNSFYGKKLIFAHFFRTASVWLRSLDQPLVPGVFPSFSMHFFSPTSPPGGFRGCGAGHC